MGNLGVKKALVFIGLIVLVPIGGKILTESFPRQMVTLRVKYSLSALKASNDLFDPTDHESIYTYYLAENLGVGLVRDEPSSPVGYSPMIAETWKWDGDKEWQFKIRKSLKWSDGSPIMVSEIVEHLRDLGSGTHRHLSAMRSMDKINVVDERTIVLTFRNKMSEILLHELSLADAVLYKKDSIGRPIWNVTSGPYFVSGYKSNENLVLEANTNSVIYNKYSPQRVEMIPLVSNKGTLSLGESDVATVPSPIFSESSQQLIESAPKIKQGAASSIYFFGFNESHPLTRSLKGRQELRNLLQSAFASLSLPQGLSFESQMIPKAYDGRLEHAEELKSNFKVEKLAGKTVTLVVTKSFRNLGSAAIDKLNETFKKNNVKLDLKEMGYFEPNPKNDHLARLVIFSGNQSDASGSWNFHLVKGGALMPFIEEIKSKFFKDPENKNSKKVYLELHKHVLDNAYLIPFLAEQTYTVHSERVNLDRWNPFDMRMRFYEVRWVQ